MEQAAAGTASWRTHFACFAPAPKQQRRATMSVMVVAGETQWGTDAMAPAATRLGPSQPGWRGRRTTNRVPSSTVECTSIVPWWASTSWAAMYRPRPTLRPAFDEALGPC